MSIRLAEIVARLGGELRAGSSAAGELQIARIATLESAKPGEIAFLANPKYQAQLATTQASAVIVAPALADSCPVAAIVHPDPYLYFARLAQWLSPMPPAPVGIHPSATVLSELSEHVSVGAGAYIGANVRIGANSVIGANAVVGSGVTIGPDCRLYPNATVYYGCRIGARAIIHAGAVIGADGFGFAREKDGSWVKIPQTGIVIVGDDVEIGAGTTIDRGALSDTVIENGVKLDNQIQIAHNVRIGAHTAIAGCVAIAGSTVIGSRCTIGGASNIVGHLTIADDVHISAGTFISKSLSKPGAYTGTVPSMEHGDWLRNFARLRHLDSMADRIRALEARLNELENKQ
ncbi:MAG TPA: UDP-3-O-(3-hydroxymyristoyl)glucosamine N-acyltransferase [Rhodocyclaceae bacterium]|nr:UDP-3-O-(3-hydroxymyristoyl)glucosamine N-acyltransferase [Rhodocyclaceae bacterium]